MKLYATAPASPTWSLLMGRYAGFRGASREMIELDRLQIDALRRSYRMSYVQSRREAAKKIVTSMDCLIGVTYRTLSPLQIKAYLPSTHQIPLEPTAAANEFRTPVV